MFKKLTIRWKLYLSFGFISLLTVAVGLLGYRGMNSSRAAQDVIATVYVPSLETITRIQFMQTDIKANQYGLLSPDYTADERKYREDKIKSHLVDIAREIQSYDSLSKSAEDEVLWKTFRTDFDEWKKKADEFAQYSRTKTSLMEQGAAKNDPRIKTLDEQIFIYYNNDVRSAFAKCEASVQALVDMNSKDTNDADTSADSAAARTTTFLVITLLMCVVFAVLVGLME
jgi:methyl-accepting chemotaxis protein